VWDDGQAIMDAAAAAAATSAPAAQKKAATAASWSTSHAEDAAVDALGLPELQAVRDAAPHVNKWTAPTVQGKPPAPRCARLA
jgi:hypothetical protein